MDARIDVITIGVQDLERSLAFYRDGLGFQTRGIVGTEWEGDETTPAGAVVMIKLTGGLTLALYPRSELAKDASVPLRPSETAPFSIGHIVARREEVDELLSRAQAAGATLTDEAHDRPWGIYSGYFADPDGHLWEVIWDSRSRAS